MAESDQKEPVIFLSYVVRKKETNLFFFSIELSLLRRIPTPLRCLASLHSLEGGGSDTRARRGLGPYTRRLGRQIRSVQVRERRSQQLT